MSWKRIPLDIELNEHQEIAKVCVDGIEVPFHGHFDRILGEFRYDETVPQYLNMLIEAAKR